MNQQSLTAHLAEQAELKWVPSLEPTVTVARSAHVRWRIQRELSNAGAGVGYERNEALAAAGLSANDIDSREFAQNLVAVLADHLTPRNLRHLAEAFAAACNEQAAPGSARVASETLQSKPHVD